VLEGDGEHEGPVVTVVLAGVPLQLWERTVEAGLIRDWDRDGIGYEVVRWEPGAEVVVARSGAVLREIHATLRQVRMTG
jgi:hypothetical protein